MTKKAQSALVLAYQISGENPIYTRRTHGAVKSAYAYLSQNGYDWNADVQAWQHSVAVERQRATLAFQLSALTGDFESVAYVITEALKDAHYKVVSTGALVDMLQTGVTSMVMVIEP